MLKKLFEHVLKMNSVTSELKLLRFVTVACHSQYLSLAGFSDAAKQDASYTLLSSPCIPGTPFSLLSPVSPLSFLSPLSLHLSLSPINKIAHLPRKLIVRLNFSVYCLTFSYTPCFSIVTFTA